MLSNELSGQHHEAIERLAEHAPLLLDDADDLEALAEDPHVAADRIDTLEEPVGDVRADDDDRSSLANVDLGERPPVGEAVVLHHLVRRCHAEHEHVAEVRSRHSTSACGVGQPDVMPTATASGIAAATFRASSARHARATLDALPFLVVEEARRESATRRTWKAFAPIIASAMFSLDVRVHPLDDRDHRDEKRDGDDDAEQREERPQLVRAKLGKRDLDDVRVAHPPSTICAGESCHKTCAGPAGRSGAGRSAPPKGACERPVERVRERLLLA